VSDVTAIALAGLAGALLTLAILHLFTIRRIGRRTRADERELERLRDEVWELRAAAEARDRAEATGLQPLVAFAVRRGPAANAADCTHCQRVRRRQTGRDRGRHRLFYCETRRPLRLGCADRNRAGTDAQRRVAAARVLKGNNACHIPFSSNPYDHLR
jgi:hypothetical protein